MNDKEPIYSEMGYNVPNFRVQGGEIQAFEGEVAFLGSIYISPQCKVEGFPQCEHMDFSTATNLETLVTEFNNLLAFMQQCGLMKSAKSLDTAEDADKPKAEPTEEKPIEEEPAAEETAAEEGSAETDE